MTSIVSEPLAALIGAICNNLPAIDAATASADDDGTRDGFYNYFTSFKVPFCQTSLDILATILQIDDIADKVNHITFGTETLDQYLDTVLRGPMRRHVVEYMQLRKEELEARPDVVLMLLHAYIPSFRSAKIKHQSRIDLKYDSPFLYRSATLAPYSEFPVSSCHSSPPRIRHLGETARIQSCY